jgi:hypothetical protein
MKRIASIVPAYFLPRLQDIVFIVVFLFAMMLGPRFLSDGDTGRHIVIGKIIVLEHHIPTVDVFSHTKSGNALTTTEWLSEAVYAFVYIAIGLNGVVLLAALLIAYTFTLVFRETFLNSRSYLLSFGLVFLIILATLFHWLARPHLFSWLMLAIWMPRMDQLARGEIKNIWQFPLLMLLWANLHGGFVLGFLVWGAYLVGLFVERFWKDAASLHIMRDLLIVGASSLVATLLNPSGIALWKNILGHVGNSELMRLQIDWHSPNFHDPVTWPFLVLVALLLFAYSKSIRSISSAQSLLMTGMMLLSMYSVRNIPFGMIVCVPMLGKAIPDLILSNGFQRVEQKIYNIQAGLRGFTWSLLTVIVVVILLVLGQSHVVGSQANTFNPMVFPVHATEWLAVHPQSGNVFNEFTWGGYLLFRLWPAQKVFIDGQTEFYGIGLVEDYLTALDARDGWDKVFEKYKIEWVFLPNNAPLIKMLTSIPQWHILYKDDISIIIRKNP